MLSYNDSGSKVYQILINILAIILYQAIKLLYLQWVSYSGVYKILHNRYLDMQVMFNFDDSFLCNGIHTMVNCIEQKCRIFNPSIEIIYKKNVSPLYLPFVEWIKFSY